eukprot:gene8789-737_t
MSLLSDLSGWIYFISWTLMYYPQIYLNHTKKSASGLSYDFVAYTTMGTTAYFLFNMILFFSDSASKEYMNVFELAKNPIQINDFLFATNSLLSSVVIVVQCLIYDGGNQEISKPTLGIVSVAYMTLGFYLLMSTMSFSFVRFLVLSGQLKLLTILFKYIPQVYFNFKRKSCKGHSLGMIVLDLLGGFFSIAQVYLIAWEQDKSVPIFTGWSINPKIGLGFLSTSFAIIFWIQHVIYHEKKIENEQLEITIEKEV